MDTHHGEIGTLGAAETLKLLELGSIGHLGCSKNEEVYVVPITYAFDDGYLYSHAKPGKKIEMMRKNPRICIQVEEVQNLFQWKSAIAWGRFEELKGDRAARAMRLLIKKIGDKQGKGPGSPLEFDIEALLETAVIFAMKIEKTTGRSEGG